MLADRQTYFENHHHQKKKKKKKKKKELESSVWSFIILFSSAFNSAFVTNVASFAFKSETFMRLQMSDLLTNSFCFIL